MTEQIQDLLRRWNWLYFAEQNPILATALAVTAVLALSYLIYQGLVLVLRSRMQRRSFQLFDLLRQQCYRPGLYTVLAFGLMLLGPLLPLNADGRGVFNHAVTLVQIFCAAWLAIRVVGSFQAYALRRYTEAAGAANVQVRKTYTQYKIFERLLVITIVLLAGITALMTFDAFRQAGLTIFASAGVAGIVVGFAAQRTLGGILAGIQIAISQPIRIDDAIMVEGDFGRVEEITLTYVVIRLWDDRRLVVPITYFIEKPFHNWTRNSSQLLGAVVLQVDLNADVAPLRAHFLAWIANQPLWDGRLAQMQVIDAKDRQQDVRFLCSAKDADHLFDLRCLVREHMLQYISANYPEALPRARVENYAAPDPLTQTGDND